MKIDEKATGMSVPTATPARPNGPIRSALSARFDQARPEVDQGDAAGCVPTPFSSVVLGRVADAQGHGERENLDDRHRRR